MMPRLFIGMPVRNGAAFIRQAINSLQHQSFRDWRLLISDNASTDGTPDICLDLAAQDPRIELLRQQEDIGAARNFREVLNRAEAQFFMWAAADDQWRSDFMATCISALDSTPALGMAFTGVENIDGDGRLIRRYPDLPSLTGPASFRTVRRYLLSREICGKANLVYSVYRLPLCRLVLQQVGFPDCWGGDMAFVLGAIARGGISIDPHVLFQKRWSQAELANAGPDSSLVPPSKGGIFPNDAFAAYKAALVSSVSGTRFATLTAFLMEYRLYREKLLTRFCQ